MSTSPRSYNRISAFFWAVLMYFPITLAAQNKDYIFPIRTGKQNFLAGTFGEIRNTHFHTGIDVKTRQRIGLPVYAISDGYLFRAKVSAYGYGWAVYLKHPDGQVSVYAHLNEFVDRIKNYVSSIQYRKESFEVDVFPSQQELPFRKGDIIGFSGNSGSSSGPHLHFEIRDENNNATNPLQHNFIEIHDNYPPIIQKVAFVTRSADARVNQLFGKYEFNLVYQDGVYVLQDQVALKGKIGIEIKAYDQMNGVNNHNGTIRTRLYIDDKLRFEERIEKLSFAKQRNTLLHYNYKTRKQHGSRFKRLYLADGNDHDIYFTNNKGIFFDDQQTFDILIEDSFNNRATAHIKLNPSATFTNIKNKFDFQIYENHLHFTSKGTTSILLDEWKIIRPYLNSETTAYYVWDLRKGTPKRIFAHGKTITTDYVSTIFPEEEVTYIQNEFEASFTTRTLFDTLYLRFEKTIQNNTPLEIFNFKNTTDPLRQKVVLTLKPIYKYLKQKSTVYAVYGKQFAFQKGKWEGENIVFSTRELTKYTILTDTIPPKIIPKIVNNKFLKFAVSDNLSGIKSYRAELNDIFLLLKYEPKNNTIFTDYQDKNLPFSGTLRVKITDNANNFSIYTSTL